MIKGVLCSSGALITRFNGRDPRLLREFWPHIKADGIEFMIYPSWDGRLDEITETVKSFSTELRVPIPVLHADKRIGELLSMGSAEDIEEARARFRTGCGIARELGAGLMVLHLWGGPASDRNIGVNISVLGDLMREAREHGVTLTVENVVCAVETPLTHIRRIMAEYPDALFTVDTKMAEFHLETQATVDCVELWSGRTAHLHVNDYSGGYKDFGDLRVRHIGEGHVDFGPFFKRVRESGYSGYATVESTSVLPDGSVDFAKLNRSLDTVRENLK
ncbi:MAG: sugar phosphate isomerase/epimerase [Clostridia bacterium]|nr:sugar phosphate isomerase/epimerase [Clostridia bacterium]